ncbi:hypothetical protein BFP70_13065 [Thioclava sp. SK-1]|uniref:hypothetical protein n=1 Tax=Thioclava sp. SK-1 TaxID=1889770 RepID=UPI000825E3F1|nr:hypothetical protein [Thioclava sp. SK-1]OCX63134.1 hypothetical protein BFP70_13065 [Thioclava sp. SK-1]
MTVTDLIFSTISVRSFSSLWYWVALAAIWSSVSHWVIGVPYDAVLRARRNKDEAAENLVLLARVNVHRYRMIGQDAGVVLAVIVPFGLTMLAVLGFGYGYELAQAVFLVAFPLVLTMIMTLRAAARIWPVIETSDPEQVARALSKHRLKVQAIGIFAMLVTALWGMLFNFKTQFVIGF